ncbi:heterokaryon incompatibility protein-domain-containing protein [Daldinia grandis]|nr:heterokaryon incompatibility protein-domain-containing protein [Daldinia grandis]
MDNLTKYHSCQYCQRFLIDLNNKQLPGDITIDYAKATDGIFFFDATLQDVLEGASHHCLLCKWLDGVWGKRYDNRYKMLAKVPADSITVCADSYNELSLIGLWEHDVLVSPGLGKCRIRSPCSLDVFTIEDDPASQFILTRPINCRPGAVENLALARSWLEGCLHSHPKCRTKQDSMPSRILRIDKVDSPDKFKINLEPTYDKVEPYVALSYCWGGDQACKTTKSRMRSGTLSIPYDKLAQSIQDAIEVTWGLGLKYLWVDALCIIQDDEGDKIEQIANMPWIYNQACITIVAARSDRASTGFLDDIDLAQSTKLAVRLPFRCPDQHGTLGSAYITYIDDSRAPEPIHSRAWTLQERYLSNRYIEFGRNQMRWVCVCSGIKDGYCDGWKREDPDNTTHVMYIYRELQQDVEEMNLRRLSEEWIADWIKGRWETIVNHYTPRKLSVSTDRSLAISGIAHVFGTHIKDDYLAGLWRTTLPSFLCWQATLGEYGYLPRPVRYQGPSWSWTGINGPISFLLARSCGRGCRAELLGSDIELVNINARYGSVRRGTLTLKGRLREAIWYKDKTGGILKLQLGGDSEADVLNEATWMKLMTVFPDTNEAEEGTGKLGQIDVSLFEIGNCVGLKRRGPLGLILRAVPCDMTCLCRRFTRLGLFQINTRSKNCVDIFEKTTPEVIEIE